MITNTKVSIQHAHGSSGRAIHLVTIYVNTGTQSFIAPKGEYIPQLCIQSRGIMDDFGSLVFVEPWR